ncbi:MAG: hypothetical protein LBE71_04310 [Dysgonamonadaceae bacterium]|nr:hypothetical protein [Dysgonamonadaceae bacterium]
MYHANVQGKCKVCKPKLLSLRFTLRASHDIERSWRGHKPEAIRKRKKWIAAPLRGSQ